MAAELSKFGVSVRMEDDVIEVRGGGIHPPTAPLCGHNDHRIVMALSTLAALTGGVIEGAEAVNKSLPDYFDLINKLGIEATVYDPQ